MYVGGDAGGTEVDAATSGGEGVSSARVAHTAATGLENTFASDMCMKSTSKPLCHHVALSVASLKD